MLVAQNSIAADHLRLVNDLLHDGHDLDVHVTNDWFPTREFTKRDLVRIIRARHIHILPALLRHWDLVIFSNHPFGLGIWFSPAIRKLYINHGLHTGKINNDRGQDGVYGKSRVVRPFSRPYYDCMFAASYFERELAIASTPALEDRVKVVGFLLADRFMQYVETDGARVHDNSIASGREQAVVHIISTWGPHSLYNTVGRQLLEQASGLSGKYRFVFSLHPRFDFIDGGMGEGRDAILDRYERQGITVDRGLDWMGHVAGSDIAISDHSSLALYHVLLDHPILLVDVNAAHYVEGSVFSLLSKICPRFEPGMKLEVALESLCASPAKADYTPVQEAMLSYRGEAERRYREEIATLLHQA